jgi:hypothetical protein
MLFKRVLHRVRVVQDFRVEILLEILQFPAEVIGLFCTRKMLT